MTEKSVDLTIITPCYNEELSVMDCAREVQKVMLSRLPKVKYETSLSITLQQMAQFGNYEKSLVAQKTLR
jgi:hypothetical protein